MLKKYLPNFITALNLTAGSIACVLASQNYLKITFILVLIGIILDFMDGFFARLLKKTTITGQHLDSFADIITFGLTPSIVLFQLFQTAYNKNPTISFLSNVLPFISFLVVIGSAFRLAKFNISIKKNHFVGLPTPANALFITALPILLQNIFWQKILLQPLTLTTIIIASVFLLNAKLIMFKINPNTRLQTIILAIISIILYYFLKLQAVPFIILSYIAISIIYNKIKKYLNSNHSIFK